MADTHRQRVLGGLFWKFLEQAGAQGVQFMVALLLARLVSKQEYGLISLISIFILIANTFIQTGFASALLQKKSVDKRDFDAVFWFTLGLAALMYGLLWLAAPAVSGFYRQPLLRPLLRAVGLVLMPGAVIAVQTAYVARSLNFRRLFFGTMLAVLISGVGAVLLAVRGYGVWALAMQQLLYHVLLMGALFIFVPWRPGWDFSFRRLGALFDFGWKLMLSGLLEAVWSNIYGLIIGRRYSESELGVYNRAEQFPRLFGSNVAAVIQSVMLPAFSRRQDDVDALRRMCRQSLRLSAFVMFPLMAGLMAVAEPMVRLLLTDKWLDCVPYLYLLCLGYALWPMHVVNLQLMNAMGRSELFLKLECIKKALGVTLLVLGLPFGIWGLLWLKTLGEGLCALLNAWPNRRLIAYGPWAQWRDQLPSALCALLMGLCVYSLRWLALTPALCLLLQLPVGVLLYILLSRLFNRALFDYAFGLFLKGRTDSRE